MSGGKAHVHRAAGADFQLKLTAFGDVERLCGDFKRRVGALLWAVGDDKPFGALHLAVFNVQDALEVLPRLPFVAWSRKVIFEKQIHLAGKLRFAIAHDDVFRLLEDTVGPNG